MNKGTSVRRLREREIALKRMKKLMLENWHLRLQNGQMKAALMLVKQAVQKDRNGQDD